LGLARGEQRIGQLLKSWRVDALDVLALVPGRPHILLTIVAASGLMC
jgi:hypothetical protein